MYNEKRDELFILFLSPQIDTSRRPFFTLPYHLGSGYIIAYLRSRGINASQFVYREPIDLYSLADKILELNPKIVGFSCYVRNYRIITLISQLLKNKNPNLLIITGGPTPTFSNELIMRNNPAFDICVRSEGEYTVYDLIVRLRQTRDISDIKGITYRSKGRLIHTPDRDLIADGNVGGELDILPSPYLNGVIPSDQQVGILTSRGCIFKCIYCNFSAMSRWTIRYHSVGRVVSELEEIYARHNAKQLREYVEIYDDTFSLNKERAKEICRRIIDTKINIPLIAQTRADKVDKELLDLMRQAGFRCVNFGLESAAPKVLYNIKKVRTPSMKTKSFLPEQRFIARLKKYVALAKKMQLNPTVSVIFGLPGATRKDDIRTLGFVKKLNIHQYEHNYLSVYAGTELSNMCAKNKVKVTLPSKLIPYFMPTKKAVEYYIPRMENAHQNLKDKYRVEEVMRLMTGNYRETINKSYPDLLFENYQAKTIAEEWVKKIAQIFPIKLCLYNHKRQQYPYRAIKAIFFSELPVNLSTTVRRQTGFIKAFFPPTTLKLQIPFSQDEYINYLPFSSYDYHGSYVEGLKSRKIQNVIFALSTHSDIEHLMAFASYLEDAKFKIDTSKSYCYFLDECRWSDADCPAIKFKRAFISKDGSVLPCPNGKKIACVGDGRTKILKHLDCLWNDMKKKRGCQNCSVQNSCSKCLFPHPLGAIEYCDLRRKMRMGNVYVYKAFRLFERLRIMKITTSNFSYNQKAYKVI